MRIEHLKIEEAPPPPPADSRATPSASLTREIPHDRLILEVDHLYAWSLSTIQADVTLPEAVPDHPRPPLLIRRRRTKAKPQSDPHTQPIKAPRKVASSVGSITTAPKIEPIAAQRNKMSTSRSVMSSPPPSAQHNRNRLRKPHSRDNTNSCDRPCLG